MIKGNWKNKGIKFCEDKAVLPPMSCLSDNERFLCVRKYEFKFFLMVF